MNFGDGDYKIKVLNNDKIATNRKELLLASGDYV